MPTEISWTDETWNPTVGCSKVSPGCGMPLPGQEYLPHGNCYACGVAHRAMQDAHVGLTIKRPGEHIDWTGEVRCLPERLATPFSWRRPRKVFVDSMSDLFHPDVPDEFIREVFAVMAATPRHTYQVLTKRPGRMASWLTDSENTARVSARVSSLLLAPDAVEALGPYRSGADLRRLGRAIGDAKVAAGLDRYSGFPWPNIWLGTSIESDRFAWRANHLRATPAAVRFLSLEPLLGPLPSLDFTGIDWVIAGGESGPGARPMHIEWVRDLRDRCVTEGSGECPTCDGCGSVYVDGVVPNRGFGACSDCYANFGFGPTGRVPIPFHFKQWGEWAPAPWKLLREPGETTDAYKARSDAEAATHGLTVDGYLRELPHRAWSIERTSPGVMTTGVRRAGKKAAGRVLDGRTWDDFPG